MANDFADYDHWFRRGMFHKCNGMQPEMVRDESDVAVCAYFDGYDANETKIVLEKHGIADVVMEIEYEPETVIHHVYTERVGEVEAMFDDEGNLLDLWANNDACWRNEYFSPFMEKLNIRVVEHYDDGDPLVEKLVAAACEHWGIEDEG